MNIKIFSFLFISLGLYAQEKKTDENVAQEYYLYLGKHLSKRSLLTYGTISSTTVKNEFQIHFLWNGVKADSITFEGEVCNQFIEPLTKAINETANFWEDINADKIWVTVPFFIENITTVDPQLRSICDNIFFSAMKPLLSHRMLKTSKIKLMAID